MLMSWMFHLIKVSFKGKIKRCEFRDKSQNEEQSYFSTNVFFQSKRGKFHTMAQLLCDHKRVNQLACLFQMTITLIELLCLHLKKKKSQVSHICDCY